MKQLFFSITIIFLVQVCTGQNSKQVILYGQCTKDSLKAAPFDKWYTTGYETYKPDSNTLLQLYKLNNKQTRIEIFFGTWCGDSKREVPRFLKLLDAFSFPASQVRLIAVGGSDSLYKQSPQHQESGKGIFRVPVFVVYNNGVETGRINEYPVYSLERDLLSILNREIYTPNYPAFPVIQQWLRSDMLTDNNISTQGLAGTISHLVKGEHELNSLGYLLLKQGKIKEALRIFQINYSLYPESSNVASSLGEGYFESGDYKKAVPLLERSLRIAKESDDIKPVLELLYKAKEKERS